MLFVFEAWNKFNVIFARAAISCVICATIATRDFNVAFVAFFNGDYGGLDVLRYALVDVHVDTDGR